MATVRWWQDIEALPILLSLTRALEERIELGSTLSQSGLESKQTESLEFSLWAGATAALLGVEGLLVPEATQDRNELSYTPTPQERRVWPFDATHILMKPKSRQAADLYVEAGMQSALQTPPGALLKVELKDVFEDYVRRPDGRAWIVKAEDKAEHDPPGSVRVPLAQWERRGGRQGATSPSCVYTEAYPDSRRRILIGFLVGFEELRTGTTLPPALETSLDPTCVDEQYACFRDEARTWYDNTRELPGVDRRAVLPDDAWSALEAGAFQDAAAWREKLSVASTALKASSRTLWHRAMLEAVLLCRDRHLREGKVVKIFRCRWAGCPQHFIKADDRRGYCVAHSPQIKEPAGRTMRPAAANARLGPEETRRREREGKKAQRARASRNGPS